MSSPAFQLSRIVRYLTTGVTLALAMMIALAFLPTLFGRQVMVVTSGSMEPSIPVGAIVVTRMVPVDDLGVGDVITYRPKGGSTTTHRIVKVERREPGSAMFVTKGDANEDVDPKATAIVGEVASAERVIPFLGRALAAMRSPIAFLALILLGMASALLEKVTTRLLEQGRDPRPVLT